VNKDRQTKPEENDQSGDRGWERWKFDKNAPVDTSIESNSHIPSSSIIYVYLSFEQGHSLDETEEDIIAAKRRIHAQAHTMSHNDKSHEEAIFGRSLPSSQPSVPSLQTKVPDEEKKSNSIPSTKIQETDNPKKQSDNKTNNEEKINNITNSKLAVQQRSRQNEWLRRVEAMREAKNSTVS
jgi:hypothetical protein